MDVGGVVRLATLFVVVGLWSCATTDPLHVYPNELGKSGAGGLSAGSGGSAGYGEFSGSAGIGGATGPTGTVGGTGGSASQQALASGQSLSLAECIDLALRTSPRTRGTYLASLAAAAGVGQTKAANFPTIEVGVGADVGGNLKGDLPNSDPSLGFTGRFTVRYLIFDAARSARVEGAEAALSAARFRHHASMLDLALEVQEAYFQLQGAAWYKAAVEELILQGNSQYNLAKARFEVGLARRYDVVVAEARVAELLAMRATANATFVQYQGRLTKAMGLNLSKPVTVASMPEADPIMPQQDLDRLMQLAVATRPELGEARANVEQALAQAQVEDAGMLPTVSADASVAATWNQNGTWSVPWSVGVGVTLPLFEGFGTQYGRQRAQLEEQRARAELEGQVNDVQFEVWAAYSAANESKEQVVALEKLVAAAQESVALATENYGSGVGTVVEVLDAQASLATARLNLVKARLDWHLAVARMEHAVGQAVSAPSSFPVEHK